MSQVAHPAKAYPTFLYMKQLGVLLLLPGWLLPAFHQTSLMIVSIHLYSWMEINMVGVKCFAQLHNMVNQPGLEPRPLNLQSSALTSIDPARSQTPLNPIVQHSNYQATACPQAILFSWSVVALSSFELIFHLPHQVNFPIL